MAGAFVAGRATAILGWRGAALPLLALEVMLTLISIGLGTMLPVTTVAIQNAVARTSSAPRPAP